ncbi:MAG: hypothetical protein IMZ62_03150 [Chloroflexi bacterium]|nr:hypothetical protein [Chloroflexota bacterium]
MASLDGMASNMASWYKPARKVLIKGKLREIDPPTPVLRYRLRKLHRFIAANFRPHRGVHGGAKGRSCFSSARVHKGRRYIIKRDVKDCYPSIKTAALLDRLVAYGFCEETARILSLLMTLNGRLPHGSPVSADALNLFLFEADEVIVAKCTVLGGKYSRTYDDMVVSTNSGAASRELGEVLESQIAAHGLEVNSRKRAKEGFQPPHKRQLVHNIDVRSAGGVRIVREHEQKALAVATRYVRAARCVSPESLEPVALLRSQAAGYMHYCGQADFGPAKQLRRLLKQGDRHVRKRLTNECVTRCRKWWIISLRRNKAKQIAQRWRALQDEESRSSAPSTSIA